MKKSIVFKFVTDRSKLPILAVMVFTGAVGLGTLRSSFAATFSNNPYGNADSCSISGNSTYIYGWAYDPQAGAGAYPYVNLNLTGSGGLTGIPSSVAGYRDATINGELSSRYPGAPRPGVYGWVAKFENLYKGRSYTLSGTILNYGAGIDQALLINSSHNVDGNTSKPYFVGDKIPDACLGALPVVAPPAPLPPVPKPIIKPSPVVNPAPAPTASPGAILSNAADGTVIIGTTSATVNVPIGNAVSAHIVYGPDNLIVSKEVSADASGIAIPLTLLKPSTIYQYKIVRTLGTAVTTSPESTFTTNGYSVQLIFTNKDSKPVSGINAQLGKSKNTSDEQGLVHFENLKTGTYKSTFVYKGKAYAEQINIPSSLTAKQAETIRVSKTINLDSLTATGAKPIAHNGAPLWAIALVGLTAVGVILGVILLYVRRREKTRYAPPLPAHDPITPFSVTNDYSRDEPVVNTLPTEPLPEHAGISLRDMVIESMHEEALRRKPPKDQ